MSALKWIIAEAKKLKKQYPKRFKTWTEYVKQASAIYATKHKGKSPVGKKHKIGAVKKTATKKPKVKTVETRHKDTKSHNVNIRVMSGVTKDFNEVNKKIEIFEKQIENHKKAIANKKLQPTVHQMLKKQLVSIKKYLTELKKHKSEIKKLI